MPNNQPSSLLLAFMLTISIFGLLLISALALNTPKAEESLPWREPLIGSMFALICIGGIVAVFFPSKCAGFPNLPKNNGQAEPTDSGKASTRLRGHHPACQRFSAHTVKMRSICLCAACAGLFLGALVSLVGIFGYFFAGWSFSGLSYPSLLIGSAGIIMGFLQFEFKAFMRVLMNAFFVLGSFLVLVAVGSLAENLLIDLCTLFFIVFWLLTRISISKWNNSRICLRCEFCELGKKS